MLFRHCLMPHSPPLPLLGFVALSHTHTIFVETRLIITRTNYQNRIIAQIYMALPTLVARDALYYSYIAMAE